MAHPVGDLSLRDGICDDAQLIAPALQLPQGVLHVIVRQAPPVMIAPQSSQPGGVGSDALRRIVRQQVLQPQFHLGHIQKHGLGLLAVGFPIFFQLFKEYIVGLLRAHKLHQLPLGSGGEFRILHHIPQRRAHIKENGINVWTHNNPPVLCLNCFAETVRYLGLSVDYWFSF